MSFGGNYVFLFVVMATDTYRVIIGFVRAAAVYVLGRVIVTVERASFGRGKSRYGVIREVVGFKRYKAVVVGRLDRNEIAVFGYVPNRYAVNVFAFFKFVRKRDRDFSAEFGNVVITVVDGEIVDRIVADLFEFIFVDKI